MLAREAVLQELVVVASPLAVAVLTGTSVPVVAVVAVVQAVHVGHQEVLRQ